MVKLTNGKVIVEVPSEKAENYALIMGYRFVDEKQEEPELPIPEPRKPARGRPPKKAS